MNMIPKTIHRSTHAEFATHLFWAKENADSLQERINQGVTVTLIARERNMSVATLRKALDAVGVLHGQKHPALVARRASKKNADTGLLEALLGAVTLLADAIGVATPTLDQYRK